MKERDEELIEAAVADLQELDGVEGNQEDALKHALANAICEVMHMEEMRRYVVTILADLSPLPNAIDRMVLGPLAGVVSNYICEKVQEAAG